MKMKIEHFKAAFGAKPFLPGVMASEPVSDPGAPSRADDETASLPLKLGPMGTLATGRVFDNKIAGQSDFQFSAKGGDQWKGKVERYLISQAPACHALFYWAERQSQPITQTKFEEAVGYGLTVWGRDGDEKEHS